MRKDPDSPIIMLKEGEFTPCGLYLPYGVVTNINIDEVYKFLTVLSSRDYVIVYKFICNETHEGYVCLIQKEEPHIDDINHLKVFIHDIIHRIDLTENDINTRIDGISIKLNSSKDEKDIGSSMYILYEFLPEKLKKELKIHIKK